MTCSLSFIFFQAIATDTYNGLPYLHSSARLALLWNVMQLRYECLLQWEQNRSKAMMWQLYEFQEFWGCQQFLSRLMAVCCMLLPHNPYRLPKHYKRHVCGPSCSCNLRYLWVSPIFEHYISLIYMGYSTPLTTILVMKEFLFHRPVLIFQPTENSRANNNQSTRCQMY